MYERYGELWTEEEDQKLISLSNEGVLVEDIALELNRSVNGVIYRRTLVRRDIDKEFRKRRNTYEVNQNDAAEIVEIFLNEHATIAEIERRLGIPRYHIKKTLEKKGIDPKKARLRKIIDPIRLQELASSGEHTINSIANHFNISAGALQRNIEFHGTDVSKVKLPSREPWKMFEIEKLARMVKQGQSFWRIGLELNRTAVSCRTKAYSLGVTVAANDLYGVEYEREDGTTGRFWTKEDSEKLEELYSRGMFIAEIAKEMDRSYHSIQKKAHYMNLYEKYAELREVVYMAAMNEIGKGENENG